jgi:hypothetical protein
MATPSEVLTSAATGALSTDVRALLCDCGIEDHGEIVWVSFSDDGGATRIVFRAHRQDVTRVFALLDPSELRNGLVAARDAGQRKVFWGLRDE